ncbi:AraC family transcriptional regulator [Pseudomonas oryzihabitans]|uniref:AraC family transcriptional regulator n=1 Tax=Pseudomonas oryzihabitans TaxID=47885 RepID=UPI0028956561|nr:AraC family transcriptional regulator [Pseudomonas oryzihabitans]MDT3719341.1 AraC family transcriptional regulator [Pseudomonas oryzihabitans]
MKEQEERARLWSAPRLGGVELLHAHYRRRRFAPHAHDGYVFALIERGVERFNHRGIEHFATVGSLVLINPDELHTGATAVEEGWQYRGFYPTLAQLAPVFAELGRPLQATPAFATSVLHDPQVSAAFSQLHRLADQGAEALEQQTAWREALLLLFGRHARLDAIPEPGREPLAVQRARELLGQQLQQPPSLEELAQAVGLSPFHFLRVFRRATGLPPHAWLKQQRLTRAQGLLRAGWAPLEVALHLGFADQSHLGRQFKQAYGVAPGAYRRAWHG